MPDVPSVRDSHHAAPAGPPDTMPFAVRTLDGAPFVLARLYETVSFDDSLNMLESMTDHPGALAGFGVICDVRAGQVDLNYGELHELTSFVRRNESVFSGMRWAMVVTGLLEFGLARSAGLMTNDLPFEYRVFRDIDEACNWVGLPEKQFAAHQEQSGVQPV